MRWRLGIVLVLGLLAAVCVAVPAGSTPPMTARPFAPDGVKEGHIAGWSVAADGDRLAVLAPGYDPLEPLPPGVGTHIAVMERIDGVWIQSARIPVPAIPMSGTAPLAFDGDTIALGMSSSEQDGVCCAGAVIVFRESPTGWELEAELASPMVEHGASFGWSVALDGNRLAVGEPFCAGTGAGRAWVFERDAGGWGGGTALPFSESATGDQFGYGIDIEGGRIGVGAPGFGGDEFPSGGVALYEDGPAGWAEVAVLPAPPAEVVRPLGFAVSISGPRVAVLGELGAVVFEPDGVGFAAQIIALSDAGAWLSPAAFEMSGDRLLVGAPITDPVGAGQGQVVVLERAGGAWTRSGVLRPSISEPPCPTCGVAMGLSAAFAGAGDSLIVAGAPGDGTFGRFGGLLWEFEVGPALPSGASVGDATVTESSQRGAWVPAVFPVTLAEPAATDVTVGYETRAGTAEAGTDFEPSTGNLTIAAGEQHGSVTVWVKGDAFNEGPGKYASPGWEQFSVHLTGVTGATIGRGVGVGTIRDSAPGVSIGDLTVVEPDVGSARGWVTVSLDQPAVAPVQIDYTTVADGTATEGIDFLARSGTVTIPAGKAFARIQVWVRGDTTVEPEETFSVQVTSVTGATVADGRGTIGVAADE